MSGARLARRSADARHGIRSRLAPRPPDRPAPPLGSHRGPEGGASRSRLDPARTGRPGDLPGAPSLGRLRFPGRRSDFRPSPTAVALLSGADSGFGAGCPPPVAKAWFRRRSCGADERNRTADLLITSWSRALSAAVHRRPYTYAEQGLGSFRNSIGGCQRPPLSAPVAVPLLSKSGCAAINIGSGLQRGAGHFEGSSGR